VTSVARPADTVGGHTELVREWTASNDRWGTVLLVHGLGEHSGRYERVGERMAAAGLDVVGFDLIGFGASSGPRADVEDWSLWLDQVEGHMRRLSDRGPVFLLGHSMGGLIALDYVVSQHVPAPSALVLSAPALGGGRAWQRPAALLLGRLAGGLRVPNMIRGEQLSRDPKVGEAYFADPLVVTSSTARLGAALFSAMGRVAGKVDSIGVPTLVLHGGDDTIVPAAVTAPLAAVPAVERRLYPRLRHELFNEPEGMEVVDEVVDWLRSRAPSGD
jgi:alpha-beta hydrolase superfamily lysophospholipase